MQRTGESGLELLRNHYARPPLIITLGLSEMMRVAYRIVLWNVAAVAILFVIFISTQWLDYYFSLDVHHATGAFLFFGSPGILALWLLVLGAWNASKRNSVLAIAVASGFLILLQSAVLGFAIAYSKGFDATRSTTHFEALLVAVLVAGYALIGWFVRAKRSPAKDTAQPGG